AAFDELVHEISGQVVHNGQRAEHLSINARQGSHIYYQYSVGKGPITDELVASIWLKGNRPGIQLLARVVLPAERDPNNLDTCLKGKGRSQGSKVRDRGPRARGPFPDSRSSSPGVARKIIRSSSSTAPSFWSAASPSSSAACASRIRPFVPCGMPASMRCGS